MVFPVAPASWIPIWFRRRLLSRTSLAHARPSASPAALRVASAPVTDDPVVSSSRIPDTAFPVALERTTAMAAESTTQIPIRPAAVAVTASIRPRETFQYVTPAVAPTVVRFLTVTFDAFRTTTSDRVGPLVRMTWPFPSRWTSLARTRTQLSGPGDERSAVSS